MSTINETLKQKIDELDLDRRVNEAVESGEQLLKRALEAGVRGFLPKTVSAAVLTATGFVRLGG